MDKACVYCLASEGESQRLTDLAQLHGWTVTQTLTEQPSTAPDQRAGLAAIRRMVAKGEVQALVVPSLTMLGGSLDEIVETVSRLAKAKVALIADADGIDSVTAAGSAWMAAVASLRDYKEKIRKQAARAGQLRARAAGQHCGRPPIPASKMAQVRAELRATHGAVRPTARKLGLSAARVALEKKLMTEAETAAQAAR